MSVPLKLKNTADFQKMSTTEENYLAYQAGLELSSLDSSNVGTLGTNLSGDNRTVGTFIDTSYDSAIGTSEANGFLSTTSISTIVRQKAGHAPIHGDSDYRIPIFHTDDNGTTPNKLTEMDSADVNTLIDRINSRIYTSDYPGTYKLAASAPSGDYTLNKTGVMVDTRTDGTVATYNLYKRTSMSAPTTVLPFAIKRSGGHAGTYQGIQRMTPRQVAKSFGVNSRNRTAETANNVGTYKIFSATEGTPSANGLSGTWQAKGTATDTRKALVGINYTRSRTSTYSRLRTSTYSADYTRTRASTYLRSSTTSRTSTYSATYTTTRTSNYSPSFVGNYVGNYVGGSTATSTRSSTATLSYTRTSTDSYIGNYARLLSYVGNYSADFVGNYAGTEYLRSFSRTLYVSVDQETFYYTGNFSTDYIGNYVGNYARTSTKTSTYSRTTSGSFTGNYSRIGTYAGNFIGDFTGEFTRDSQRITSDSFTRNFTGNYSRNFSADYARAYSRTRATNFARSFAGNYTGEFAGNFVSDVADSGMQTFTGNYSRTVTTGSTTIQPAGNQPAGWRWVIGYDASFSNHTFIVIWNSVTVHSQTFPFTVDEGGSSTNPWANTTSVVGSDGLTYTRGSLQQVEGYVNSIYGITQAGGTVTTNYVGEYQRKLATGNYTGNYAATFTGNYLGGGKSGDASQYTRTTSGTAYTRTSTVASTRSSSRVSTTTRSSNYTGNFVGNYSRNFTGNYARNFARTRSSSYIGASAFARDFVGNFIGNYTRVFDAQYTGNYSRNFAGNYVGNYARNFIGDYSRTFVGNYAGTEIGSSNTNIETYTLYVRIA